ncbi:arsenic resistance N-acetyltransferase ArsN2 [Sphingomonas sp. H39-1-10]|uniref:arsenic resistance N-acetyltransferase ArsN2 n=1 Tax=Sphingomonas pollutisoli TaxID=3030829 RepID=UPI0023B88DF3|nr:arsenic resistance N-acetyltransferase ArsN2 [Sphingomonas pollutisoli]MDF0491399.1 arsenic resistance N-acetyltransferase ArsN2 [Sphingomonas pollutisoli]
MIVTVLDAGSLPDLAAELAASGLPVSDLAEPDRQFYRLEDDAGVIGYGGVEGAGADRLLRSLVVKPDRRGRASGSAMLAAIERASVADGAVSFYLLTTTAAPFFRRHGYRTAERADAPATIAGSAEFRSLCPASAAFLSKRIA